jgi:hypothetical protein
MYDLIVFAAYGFPLLAPLSWTCWDSHLPKSIMFSYVAIAASFSVSLDRIKAWKRLTLEVENTLSAVERVFWVWIGR